MIEEFWAPWRIEVVIPLALSSRSDFARSQASKIFPFRPQSQHNNPVNPKSPDRQERKFLDTAW
jgi:hypothetical protein